MADCFSVLRENLPSAISDKDIKDFLDHAQDLKSQSDGEGLGSFRQKMMAKVESERLALAKYKQKIAQNLMHNNERWSRMSQPAYDGKPWEALAAESQGGRNYITIGGNQGIHDVAAATESSILTPMQYALKDAGAWEKLKTGEMDQDVFKELYEQKDNGNPGVSKNPTALEAAKVIRAATDRLRTASESAGYPIGKIEGYIPQTHNPIKIESLGKENFIKLALEKFDSDKTFGEGATSDDKMKFLSKMYDKVINHQWSKTDVPEGASDKFVTVSEKGIGSKLGGSRSVFFKDAESAFDYNNVAGNGNLLDTVSSKISSESRRVAQLSKYGSNPLEAFAGDIAKQKAYYNSDAAIEKYGPDQAQKIRDTLAAKEPSLMSGFKISAGLADQHATELPAKLANAVLGQQNAAKLWAAAPKKLTEWAYGTGLTSSSTGSNFLETAVSLAKQYFSTGLPSSEAAQNVHKQLLVNFLNDVNASQMTDRYGMGFSEPGMLSKMNDLQYKYGGINALTNKSRIAIAADYSRRMALNATTDFEALHPRLQASLGKYNISSPEWDLLKNAVGTFGHDGSQAMLSSEIPKIDPKIAQGIMDQNGIKGSTDKFLNDTQIKYVNMLQDLTETSVLHSNIPALNTLRGQSNINTYWGMMRRLAVQFKSVGLMMGTVTERILKSDPELPMNPSWGEALKGSSTMQHLIPTMAMGTGIFAAQDALMREIKGLPKRDYSKPETGMEMFAGGSGAGLWGDALLGQASSSGEKATKFLAGPTLGTGYDLVDDYGKLKKGDAKGAGTGLVKLIEDNTPGQTIPYMRHAMDSLFFDHVQNTIDPEYTDKRELRQEKQKAKEGSLQ